MRIGENGNEFLNNLNIPRLSEEQKQSCEGEIFLEEITAIPNSFKSNKFIVYCFVCQKIIQIK